MSSTLELNEALIEVRTCYDLTGSEHFPFTQESDGYNYCLLGDQLLGGEPTAASDAQRFACQSNQYLCPVQMYELRFQ